MNLNIPNYLKKSKKFHNRSRISFENLEGHLEILDIFDENEIKCSLATLKALQAQRRELEALLTDDVRYEPDFSFNVGGAKAKYVHPEGCMKILGSMVSGAGKTSADVEHRVDKAWRAFWSQRSILLNKLVDPKHLQRSHPVLLYACCTWTPTKADLDKVQTAHKQTSYKIFGVHVRAGEAVAYMECLRCLIRSEVIPSSYLLVGPEGFGKMFLTQAYDQTCCHFWFQRPQLLVPEPRP